MTMMNGGKQQMHGILAPHDHDVLSGRGNFVNYHAGNEHFRALVRKHKLDYVQCPKPQKGKFSRMIVDEIKNRNPPGRFLKQDGSTKLWYDIGDKKALDKTRQALREGAPDIMKDIVVEDGVDGETDGLPSKNDAIRNTTATGVNPDVFAQGGGGNRGLPQDNFRRNHPAMNMADMSHPFMTGMGNMQSPVGNQRHHLQVSPQISQHISPRGGMLSPGMLGMPHTPLSPEIQGSMQMNMQSRMHQLASGQMQLQLQQLEQHTALHDQCGTQQINPHMGMQNQMMNHPGIPNFQNDLEALRMKQRQIEMLQAKQREMEALQAKLNAAYQNEHFEPRAIDPHFQSTANQPIGKMRKTKMAVMDGSGQQQQHHQQQQQHQNQQRNRNDPRPNMTQSDHFPRRKPPPNSLKRENSLKIEKVFVGDGTTTKKKYDGNGSSAHLSAMSLSIGDMADETNLSSVFDSSLKISNEEAEFRDTLSPLVRKKPAIPSLTNAWEAKNPFDMSVNTIGDKVSEVGNMSVNTFADKMGESESNMSFSKLFEDSG